VGEAVTGGEMDACQCPRESQWSHSNYRYQSKLIVQHTARY